MGVLKGTDFVDEHDKNKFSQGFIRPKYRKIGSKWDGNTSKIAVRRSYDIFVLHIAPYNGLHQGCVSPPLR